MTAPDQAPALRDSEADIEGPVETALYDVVDSDGNVVERVHLSAADAQRWGGRVRPSGDAQSSGDAPGGDAKRARTRRQG